MISFVLYHQRGFNSGHNHAFTLDEGESIALGRRHESDIAFHPVHDIKASGRHARILVRDGALILEDLASSNGTFVNDSRVIDPVPLAHGDCVEFGAGGPRLLVDLDPSSDATSDTIVDGEEPVPEPDEALAPEPVHHLVDRDSIATPAHKKPFLPPTLGDGGDENLPHPTTQLVDASSEPTPAYLQADEDVTPEDAAAVAATSEATSDPEPEATSEPAPPERKRSIIGATTVAMMIKKAQSQSSRRFVVLIIALAALLLTAIAAIVILALRTRETEDTLAQQQARLTEQQAELQEQRDEVARAREALKNQAVHFQTQQDKVTGKLLAARLEIERDRKALQVEVSDQLRSEFQESQRALVESLQTYETTLTTTYGPALYMLIAAPREDVLFERIKASGGRPPEPGAEEGFCTAFAITPDGWLATNAHCIDAIYDTHLDFARKGIPVSFVAKQHDSKKSIPLRVETAVRHPRHTHVYSPDVAVIKMDLEAAALPPLTAITPIAEAAELQDQLAPGQPIYTLGFPGKVMNAYNVLADFRGGNVARLTAFDTASDTPDQRHWVWHTALISKGTSGSPIFDRRGRVVAVNSGTESVERVLTDDGTSQSVKFIYSADALNFGVRADLLLEVVELAGITLPPAASIPALQP